MTPQILQSTIERFIQEHQAWAIGGPQAPRTSPPALNIRGYQGSGKTSIACEAARACGAAPLVVDAIQRDAIDMGGLPDVDRRDPARPRTVRAVPDLVSEIEILGRGTNGLTVLIWDDFVSMSRMQMAACTSAFLRRVIGGAELPRGCYVMATSNRSDEGVVYNDMPTNVHTRMIHLELDRSLDDWCDWAIAHGFSMALVAAVREDSQVLHELDRKDPFKASSTGRTLEFVNRILEMGLPLGTTRELVNGAIGLVPGTKLMERMRTIDDIPKIEEVLRDPKGTRLPKEAGSRYALARSLALRLEERTTKAISTSRF